VGSGKGLNSSKVGQAAFKAKKSTVPTCLSSKTGLKIKPTVHNGMTLQSKHSPKALQVLYKKAGNNLGSQKEFAIKRQQQFLADSTGGIQP
jgi:hypothetical protein